MINDKEGTWRWYNCKRCWDKYIEEYYRDADGLNIKRASVNPRATEFVEDIIEFISGLIEKVMLMK